MEIATFSFVSEASSVVSISPVAVVMFRFDLGSLRWASLSAARSWYLFDCEAF